MDKRKLIGYVLCAIAYVLMAWPARSEFDNPGAFDNGSDLANAHGYLEALNQGALNMTLGVGQYPTGHGVDTVNEPLFAEFNEFLCDLPTEARATRLYVAEIRKDVAHLRQAMFWFIGLYLVTLTVHGWRV
jgi:hypothetical protein